MTQGPPTSRRTTAAATVRPAASKEIPIVVVGTLQITIQVPESHSLKDKRMVVRSITSRIRQTFAVAVAGITVLAPSP